MPTAKRRRASSAGGSDLLYLQRIGTRWYARIPVPNNLRKAMGPYVRKALDTSDLVEARRRRWDVLEMARARFANRLGTGVEGNTRVEDLSYEAFRSKLRELGPPKVVDFLTGEELDNPAIDAIIDELADAPADSDPVQAVRDHIAGHETVTETLKSYLEGNPKRSATTIANYDTTVKLWRAKHGERPVGHVTRKQALEWLEGVSHGKARDTLKRYATVMTHLWAWAHRSEEDPPRNPFEGLLRAVGTKGKARQSHGFYQATELVQAFRAVAPDDELRSVFLMSVYTGFRLDECLRAERRDLHGVECYVPLEQHQARPGT